MKHAKLIEIKTRDVVISGGKNTYPVEKYNNPVVPVYSKDLEPDGLACIVSERVELPIIRISTSTDKGNGQHETVDNYFILSEELRESMDIIRAEEEQKYIGTILGLERRLKDREYQLSCVVNSHERIESASFIARFLYCITGKLSKLTEGK